MKKFVLIALAAATLALAGCTTIGSWFDSIGGDKDAPAIQVGKTQFWYGRVNTWAQDEALLKSDLEKMSKKKGVYQGYLIELLSWGRYSAYANDQAAWKAKTESAYKLLVKEARKRGFWVHVSIANDNSGSGKYGDQSPVLEKQQDLLNWGVNLVLAQGSKNIVVQPVAETTRPWSKNWETATGAKFKAAGFVTCNNRGSRPGSLPSWATWNAWHPFKISDKVPGNQINITDTGTIIQQLCWGLEGAIKKDTVQAYKNQMVAQGIPALGIYHFKYLGSDPNLVNIQAQSDDVDWLDLE